MVKTIFDVLSKKVKKEKIVVCTAYIDTDGKWIRCDMKITGDDFVLICIDINYKYYLHISSKLSLNTIYRMAIY